MDEDTQVDAWSQLSEGERALILRSLKRKKDQRGRGEITRRPDPDSAPLSYSQEQLWFLDQFEPGVTAYNRPWALRIRGSLNTPVLEKSLNEIVRRHEALRTNIVSSAGKPSQRILPFHEYSLPLTDLSEGQESEKETIAIQIVKDDAFLPFDLTRDSLFRPRLVRLSSDDHVLLLTTHHIAFDGWSERVIFRELCELYQSFLTNTPSKLLQPNIQFPDFAHWQRDTLAGEKYDQLSAFWKNELDGAPPLLRLSTDYDRPHSRSYDGASLKLQLSKELSESLKGICRQEGVTLFMALLAAYNVTLLHDSGELDIVVGGTISGRPNLHLEKAIGFFVNTLVLRSKLEANLTFRELLARVRETTLRALSHQEMPFEKLVEILNPARSLSYTPVVQVTLQLRNLPDRGAGIPGLEIEEFDLGFEQAQFDLSLSIEDLAEGLFCKLLYNRALFSKNTAQRFLRHFEDVVHALIADPGTPISELRWIDPEIPPERKIVKPIVDLEIQEKSNLTGTQLMVWAGQKFRPDSLLFNLPYTFSIQGHIDRHKFQQSIQELVDKHDALRSIIIEEDGLPQQTILAHMPVNLGYEDFSGNSDPMSAAKKWIAKESRKAFNLSERLFDTTLIQLAEDHWIWFLHIHHIIADNTSIKLIFYRLQKIYDIALEDREQLKIAYPQFGDYVAFEKNNIGSPRYRSAEAYWSNKLSSPSNPLLFFGERKLKETTLVKRFTFKLEEEICKKLYDLAMKEPLFTKSVDVTLTNIFASLIFTFLYRVTKSMELSLGIHFHKRLTPQFQQTVGLLMEVLPLRISIDDGETFSTLIKKVNREAIEILRHRNFAIGNPYQHPIYEVTLNYQKMKMDSFLGSPTEFQRVHKGHDEDTLNVQIRDYGSLEVFTLDFDFHLDVFSETNQQRSIDYFQRILKAVLENPDQTLDNINILSEKERAWLLHEINQTHKPYSEQTTVVQLIEKQVDDFPENTAVVHEDRTLTYRQLNSKANQVAHKLLKLGLKHDEPVGIFVDRSVEMVISILGILKAGCAYLPLDPKHPVDRLKYILGDSCVAAVLTQRNLRDRLPGTKIHRLLVDEWDEFIDESESNLEDGAGPRHAAYVIYTSGSTGVPKGITIEHHSLVNFTEWASKDWEIDPKDRVLQFTSISWDAHIEEIFPTLCSGATLVLRTKTMIDTFQSFMETIQREEISVIDLPTAFWHELTDAIEHQKLDLPASIRLVIIGGDQASHYRTASWMRNVRPGVRLVNTYGLTECTSIATQIDLTEEFNPDGEVVSIGKPINNVQIYVLDQHKNSVPIGLPGEMWIGGAGLARGYFNKQDLTADVFFQNPFTQSQNDRIYRSGDYARVLPDGNLEMLGRLDNQVKVRGYRIELGEIEVVLGIHPAIEEVVVVAREDDWFEGAPRGGGRRLIAYYLHDPNFKLEDASDVFRNFLRDKLPDYMIPSYFIKLETFPLTPHGKIDRQALPQPDRGEIEKAHAYVAPRDSLESQLVEIWQHVLGVQPIGVMDNFFDLGGHSLMAVRLFSLIEKEVGFKLPLMTLFDAPTIANQAKSLQSAEDRDDPAWVVDVQTEGSKPPFFCVSPTIIDVMTYRELSRNMGEDQPFYALYSESLGLWREGVEHLETIAMQFIQKIREIDQNGPYLIGGYSAGGKVALEIAKQLRDQGYQVGLLVLFDTFGPDYPRLLPGITRGTFTALLVVRRIQSYFWKFRLLDWSGKIQYLRFPRIQTWVRDRYGEVKAPPQSPAEKGAYFLSPARREYQPEDYDGKVLLVRARKSLLGIHRDPMMGWGEVFSNNFEVCMVPGDHEAILFGPRSKYVADKLNSYLSASLNTLRHE